MWRTSKLGSSTRRSLTHSSPVPRLRRDYSFTLSPNNLIQIQSGTFYREHPSSISGSNKSINPPFFKELTFSLPSTPASQINQPSRKDQHWAVIGANDTTAFLEVLRGSLLCIPPKARTYPYLTSEEIIQKDPTLSLPSRAIQYVGFNSKDAGLGSASAGVRGAYLSARYESRREETDWTLSKYLRGDTELNPDRSLQNTLKDDDVLLKKVIQDLQLEKLLEMPVSNLSNGQTRRSRIAKALLSRPELLLLDEPFMGLDPPTLVRLSQMLKGLAWRSSPLLFLALRPQDPIPDWISHLIVLGERGSISLMGTKADVLFRLRRWVDLYQQGGVDANGETLLRLMDMNYGKPLAGVGQSLTERGIEDYATYDQVKEQEKKYFDGSLVRLRAVKWETQKLIEAVNKKPTTERTLEDWFILVASVPSDFEATTPKSAEDIKSAQELSPENTISSPQDGAASPASRQGEPLIELQNLVLKYGTKTVLGHPPPQVGYTQPGLNLTICRGTRMALLGPNGSGKTTLLSLLTSDHPQSYSLPMRFFGRSRLPSRGKPGLSLWEIQSQIGHSSPEVHAFFPKKMTIRQTLESSWAETFSSRPDLTPERSATVDAVLRWWEPELRQSSRPDARRESDNTTAVSHKNPSSPSSSSSNDSEDWATSKHHTFATLPFSNQRLLLLLRALIKQPSIIILDEAFSGLSSNVRDKAMDFLHHGIPQPKTTSLSSSSSSPLLKGLTPDQALIVVSHIREEIPDCVNEWIRLPSEEEATEYGKAVEMGFISDSSNNNNVDTSDVAVDSGIKGIKGWNQIWGL